MRSDSIDKFQGELYPPDDSAPYTNWTISRYCWETIRLLLNPAGATLECGSGLSTLLFDAVGCRHTALEHDPNRCAASSSVCLAPLVGDPQWYDWVPTSQFDLIFIDGPPGRIGRSGIRRHIRTMMHDETIVILDDTNRLAEHRLCRQLAEDLLLDGLGFQGHSRSFSILWPRNSRQAQSIRNQLSSYPTLPLEIRPHPYVMSE